MSSSAPGAVPYRPAPGPADREHFFAAQTRNRRATWKLATLCGLAVFLMGIPLAATITPIVYAVLLIGYDIVRLPLHLPDILYSFSHTTVVPGPPPVAPRPELVTDLLIGAALVLPGLLLMLLLWVGVRAAFRGVGAGTVLRRLGAREPVPTDLEELQLVNVVAEMAIAAGVPVPRVMLVDAPIANAAAIGATPEDCTILVSRRLVDELGRDETQAVVGHLIGSVGNGDLRIAMRIVAMFQTFGVVMTMLGAAFGSESRTTLWRLVRLAFRRRSAPNLSEEADRLNDLLAVTLEDKSRDTADYSKRADKRMGLVTMLQLPFFFAQGAFGLCQSIVVYLVVGPLIAYTWRARRYLADATAVQLTRNPDGMAKALAELSARGGGVPGGAWASHLFVVGGTALDQYRRMDPQRMVAGAQELRKYGSVMEAMQANPELRAAMAAQYEGLADERAVLSGTGKATAVSFTPPIERRIARLRQQGATVDLAVRPPRIGVASLGCLGLLYVPLGILLLGCALGISGLALAITGIFLGMPVMLLHVLLAEVLPKHL